jgi:hypothetical protein
LFLCDQRTTADSLIRGMPHSATADERLPHVIAAKTWKSVNLVKRWAFGDMTP